MKTNLFCGLCLAVALANVPAQADYTPDFSSAPYVSNQTALDVDGWQRRLSSAVQEPDSIRLMNLRWDDYRPALRLREASIKNSFSATTGEKVTISFRMALNFPDGNGRRELRMWFGGAPIGEIYFDRGADNGLGYAGAGSSGGIKILSKNEIKTNSFYNFHIALDYAKRTYSIAVSGQKQDDSPFAYQTTNIAFPEGSKDKAVSSLYLINSSRVTAYLSALKIESK